MIILVVEDNPQQQEIISITLKQGGFAVDTANDGQEGLNKIELRDYDLFIIDLDLPHIDGATLVEKIRELNITAPILILTANESIDSKIVNLESGADDYLTKPFSNQELIARIHALLRRPAVYKPHVLKTSGLEINYNSREVKLEGQIVQLTQQEFRLLEFLARNKERVCSKSMIEEHIWGYDAAIESNVIEALVYKLRSKLGKKYKSVIATVPSVGYKFNEI